MAKMTDERTPQEAEQERLARQSVAGRCCVCLRTADDGVTLGWAGSIGREVCPTCSHAWQFLSDHGHSLRQDGDDITAFLRWQRAVIIFLEVRGVIGEEIGRLLANLRYGEEL